MKNELLQLMMCSVRVLSLIYREFISNLSLMICISEKGRKIPHPEDLAVPKKFQ